MKIQIILIILGIFSVAFSKATEPDLQKVLSKLRNSPMVTLTVEKKTKSELLGKETAAPGKIYLSSKKFRWDSEGTENSKIIYDGKNIWTIQEAPKGFKAPPQITKMRLDAKSESQVFLSRLFHEKFKSQFKLMKKDKKDGLWNFYLKPLQKKANVSELIIKVDEKNNLREISYVDEIQNKIVVAINKTTISNKSNTKLFQYKPPVGTQVNEL